MLLPDGSVIMHDGAPYDPAKAHQYYIKTRELKGRQAGARPTTPSKTPSHKATSYTVRSRNGNLYQITPQQLAEQKAYAAKRVAQLKQNLHELSKVLRDKIEEARKAEAKSAKPPTAAEKAKTARDAAAYRQANQQQIANKAKTAASQAPKPASSSSASKPDTVDSLKTKITTTKANLKAAVAKQRDLAMAKKNG